MTLRAAVAEAVFLIGAERNADVVRAKVGDLNKLGEMRWRYRVSRRARDAAHPTRRAHASGQGASARDAASRISSSGWERDERTAFSTCECMLTWRSQWGYSGVGDGREDGVQHLTARRAVTRQ